MKRLYKYICCEKDSVIGRNNIARFFQLITNIFWVLVALLSAIYAGLEIINLSKTLLKDTYEVNKVLHQVVTIFLFIEIVTMVKKYFEENYHFPLRYVIYIAITALARHIIGDFNHAVEYSISILILVIAYSIIRFTSNKTKSKEELPKHEN